MAGRISLFDDTLAYIYILTFQVDVMVCH